MTLRIKYNLKAFSALRTAPGVDAFVGELAERMATACGEGYEVATPQKGRRRARRIVTTATYDAALDNSANQTLLRNLPEAVTVQRVAPAPIEQDFVAWAATALPGVRVGTRVPTDRPAQFVRVLRGAGARRNLAQSSPSLVVECWGSTDAGAWSLASRVWALLAAPDLDRVGSTWVSDAEVSEPVNSPDLASGTPRYVFTFYPLTILKERTP